MSALAKLVASAYPTAACLLVIALWPTLLTAQALPTSVGRQLAPDALNIIAPAMEPGETYQGSMDLPLPGGEAELSWKPYEDPDSQTLPQMVRAVDFRSTIHCLEFAFKPVRMIQVSLSTPEGVQSKLVWYLVYRVRYLGNDFHPTVQPDDFDNKIYGIPKTVSTSWVRFMPSLTLQTKGKINQRLLDQVLPAALPAIEAKERIGRPLFDSLSMQTQKIQVSMEANDQAVWGVATWVDVDPGTDFFTVEVKGLTNAQQIVQKQEKVSYLQKTLVLNFFRPGDIQNEQDDIIRYGVPAVNRVAGLREELRKAIANKEYELTIVGGLAGGASVGQLMKDLAQTVSSLGGQQIKTYSRTGHVVFSNQTGGQESKIQQAIERQLGVQVKVVDRTIPLGDVIRKAELAKDEQEQSYILQQYGLQERLDHYWVYR
jgi:hypothetical protein